MAGIGIGIMSYEEAERHVNEVDDDGDIVSRLKSRGSTKPVVPYRVLDEGISEREWDWIADMIGVGDYVVIACRECDDHSLALPDMPSHVWVIRVESFASETGVVTGIFLFNETRLISDPLVLRVKDSVTITDESIMSVYDNELELELKVQDIEEIQRYVRLAMGV